MLHAQVVLHDIRRAQVGIDEEDASSAEGNKAVGGKINVGRGRPGWKSIDVTRGGERIRQVTGITGSRSKRIEVKAVESEEGRLAIELKVVFALQDIIENAKPAAHTGLAIGEWVPGKAKTWREVILVRGVGALGRSGVTGKEQTGGRVAEYRGIGSQLEVKGAARRIQLR